MILTNFFFLSEEKTRFKIFCENMRKAKKLQDVEKGTAVYGITKFSDMSGKFIFLIIIFQKKINVFYHIKHMDSFKDL